MEFGAPVTPAVTSSVLRRLASKGVLPFGVRKTCLCQMYFCMCTLGRSFVRRCQLGTQMRPYSYYVCVNASGRWQVVCVLLVEHHTSTLTATVQDSRHDGWRCCSSGKDPRPSEFWLRCPFLPSAYSISAPRRLIGSHV
jgi:hypothetical protein